MKKIKYPAQMQNSKGTVVVVVALLMLCLIGFAAIAIDVSQMMVKRNELQNVADAAALHATAKLGTIYAVDLKGDNSLIMNYMADKSMLVAVANESAQDNYLTDSSGNKIAISDPDVNVGYWDLDLHKFFPTLLFPTAVQVTTHRDTTENGSIGTLLAGVLGINSVNESATAVASLGSLLELPEHAIYFPVGISSYRFNDPTFCGSAIQFYPTGTYTGCSGWTTFQDTSPSAADLKKIMNNLTNGGTSDSPVVNADSSSFYFTGGTDASVLKPAKDLFDAMRTKNDGEIDRDDSDDTWTTVVPVYSQSNCDNPTAFLRIIGFATVKITKVLAPPDGSEIDAQVVCNTVINGKSGGSFNFGTPGSTPYLVK